MHYLPNNQFDDFKPKTGCLAFRNLTTKCLNCWRSWGVHGELVLLRWQLLRRGFSTVNLYSIKRPPSQCGCRMNLSDRPAAPASSHKSHFAMRITVSVAWRFHKLPSLQSERLLRMTLPRVCSRCGSTLSLSSAHNFVFTAPGRSAYQASPTSGHRSR